MNEFPIIFDTLKVASIISTTKSQTAMKQGDRG